MARLLLNLRHVPEDEILEVRALLDEHDIPHYETEPSLWGVSAGGIWISDNGRHAEAKTLMAEYQRERQARKRAEFEQARADGDVPTMGQMLRRHPLRLMVILALAGGLLFLTLAPFFGAVL